MNAFETGVIEVMMEKAAFLGGIGRGITSVAQKSVNKVQTGGLKGLLKPSLAIDGPMLGSAAIKNKLQGGG